MTSAWLSSKALQIAVKRREAKSKGEKERYKHLNAEFQRTARRDKKAFFSVTRWGIGLDYHNSEWFALEMNRDYSVIFEIASKYYISDSC